MCVGGGGSGLQTRYAAAACLLCAPSEVECVGAAREHSLCKRRPPTCCSEQDTCRVTDVADVSTPLDATADRKEDFAAPWLKEPKAVEQSTPGPKDMVAWDRIVSAKTAKKTGVRGTLTDTA